jgi:hypothetical protein
MNANRSLLDIATSTQPLDDIKTPVRSQQAADELEIKISSQKDEKLVYFFVSNVPLSKAPEAKNNLEKHATVTEYSDQFLHRTVEQLVEFGIDKIWINLSDKAAKRWFKEQVEEDTVNPPLMIIPVYTIKDAWIDSVVEAASHVKSLVKCIQVSINKLATADVLSFDHLIKELKVQSVGIKSPTPCSPIGPLVARLVCSSSNSGNE